MIQVKAWCLTGDNVLSATGMTHIVTILAGLRCLNARKKQREFDDLEPTTPQAGNPYQLISFTRKIIFKVSLHFPSIQSWRI